MKDKGGKMQKSIIGYTIAVIIIVLAVWFVTSHTLYSPVSPSGSSSSQITQPQSVLVSITDPPHVPNGTSSLVITYNSVALHELGSSNNTGFVSFNTTGSINLMNITNSSETIAKIGVNANQKFDMVRFIITSAVITIGNQTYNVTVPSGNLKVKLNQNLAINGSGAGLLLQLNPSVIQIYSANQTFFVMLPSAKAIVLNSSAAQTKTKVGERVGLSRFETDQLERAQGSINITSASIGVSGVNDTISVTVRNTGNQSVILKHLFIRGFTSANTTSNVSVNASIHQIIPMIAASVQRPAMLYGIEAEDSGSYGLGISGLKANASANLSANTTSNPGNMDTTNGMAENGRTFENGINLSIMDDSHVYNMTGLIKGRITAALNFRRNFFNMLNFIIAKNGTLMLPYNYADIAESEGPNGYVLSPGASVVLTFNNRITLPGNFYVLGRFGSDASSANANTPTNATTNADAAVPEYSIQPIANQTYAITVIGEGGAFATTNVTAS